MKKISFSHAISQIIGHLEQPVISQYDLGCIIFKLYKEKKYQGIQLKIRKKKADRNDYYRVIKDLKTSGILSESSGVGKGVYEILGKNITSPMEIACSVDPFSYVSHLSAMEYHGLTDRVSKMLFISSPAPKDWQNFAKQKMIKDLGEYFDEYMKEEFPVLVRSQLRKIKGKTVHRYGSTHLGAFKKIKNKMLRVATIGRTFLDMLRKPDLCGGIYHIVDIYQEYAPKYLNLIVEEANRHGSKIDKVRLGYILEERCNLKHDIIDSWVQYAQRGGSRKLDSSQGYSQVYSERWCLSINI